MSVQMGLMCWPWVWLVPGSRPSAGTTPFWALDATTCLKLGSGWRGFGLVGPSCTALCQTTTRPPRPSLHPSTNPHLPHTPHPLGSPLSPLLSSLVPLLFLVCQCQLAHARKPTHNHLSHCNTPRSHGAVPTQGPHEGGAKVCAWCLFRYSHGAAECGP